MDYSLNTIYGQMSEMNQRMLEPAMRFNEIAVRAQGVLLRQQFEWLETCMELGSKQWQALGNLKDPKDLFALQADLMTELGEKMVAATREVLALQSETKDELSGLVEESMKTVQAQAEDLRSAVTAAVEPAPQAPAKTAAPAGEAVAESAPAPKKEPAPAKKPAAKPAAKSSSRASKQAS